jgi:hypothetical protein
MGPSVFKPPTIRLDIRRTVRCVRKSALLKKSQRCGCSSVDRVLASEAKGRGFDPRQPHQFSLLNRTFARTTSLVKVIFWAWRILNALRWWPVPITRTRTGPRCNPAALCPVLQTVKSATQGRSRGAGFCRCVPLFWLSLVWMRHWRGRHVVDSLLKPPRHQSYRHVSKG